MKLESLIRDLVRLDGMMVVIGNADAVGEMYVNPMNEPEFHGPHVTLRADRWHVHLNTDRVVGAQFVEAEDHGIPFLYYVRFSDDKEETLLRLYFPNPYLDDEEHLVEFQPEKLKLFEEMRDRYVGQEGIIFVRRARQS